ncbi:MAG: hypothetical protein A2269_01320 [Lentisphaerae bacterium RIFOXYA12_FULL_60_10]|nr:MAG: hypothetical protein A2269_01320 [Lentisphaerae bacterium RIFOXYA12_FULL_60_10]
MEVAHAFMQAVMRIPVVECGEPAVPLEPAMHDAGVRMDFSRSRLADRFDRIFRMREGLVPLLVHVGRAFNKRGWALRIEDGFRSRAMQQALSMRSAVFETIIRKVLWETDGHWPDDAFVFRRMSVLVATAPKIGTHMSASAVDVSVVRLDDGGEVDRGGPYLEISERTPMASPFVTETAQANRKAITALFHEHGFVEYPYEFWHYNAGDAYEMLIRKTGHPARYGAVDLDPATGRVTPIEDPTRPLNDPAALREALETVRKQVVPS